LDSFDCGGPEVHSVRNPPPSEFDMVSKTAVQEQLAGQECKHGFVANTEKETAPKGPVSRFLEALG